MTRNLSDKPHPTPHPDQPHAMGPTKERGSASGRSAPDEAESDVPNYDSCVDDLNRLLSASIPTPDPNLESAATADSTSSPSRIDQAITGLGSDRKKEPRTSEVFQVVGPTVVDSPPAKPGRNVRAKSGRPSDPPDAPPRMELTPDRLSASDPGFEGQSDISTLPWTHLVLLSYSSALTLALIWMLWGGWSRRPPAPPPTDSGSSSGSREAESATNLPERKPAVAIPPIPPENLAALGQTIRIGELELTPLSITTMPLTLVRTFEPSTERLTDGASLVLRLRLTNVAKDRTFAPLEPGFLRDPMSPIDRSYIEAANGDTISLFPLALDSEWSIRGQTFSALEPGESTETIIGSEPGAADKLSGGLTWHVRLRVGSYRTDMLGVRFTSDEVLSAPNQNDCDDRSGP